MKKPLSLLVLASMLSGLTVSGQQPSPSGQPPSPAVSPAAPQPTGQPPVTFRAEVNYVEVDARVVDQKGAFVPGLTASDFEVLEDGKPQEVTVFSVVNLPVERTPRPLFAEVKRIGAYSKNFIPSRTFSVNTFRLNSATASTLFTTRMTGRPASCA